MLTSCSDLMSATREMASIPQNPHPCWALGGMKEPRSRSGEICCGAVYLHPPR